MKHLTPILLVALIFLCLQTASASDITIWNADAVIKPEMSVPSPNAIDSTTAVPQEKFNYVFVYAVDGKQNFTLSMPLDNAINSTDAVPQEKFNYVFVYGADATLKYTLSAPPDNALDSSLDFKPKILPVPYFSQGQTEWCT